MIVGPLTTNSSEFMKKEIRKFTQIMKVHSMLADLTKSRPESKQTPIIDLSPSASMGDTFFGGPSLNAPPRV